MVFFFLGTLPPLFGAFLRRLASLSCFALHTPLTLLLSFFLFFSSTRASFTLAGGSRWWVFFWGVPCLLFLGLLTQACFAFLLRFAHSFDSFAFILLFFQARGHPSPWQVVAGGVFFWGTLPPLFGAFLRRLASLSCFALHSLFFKHAGILHLGRW